MNSPVSPATGSPVLLVNPRSFRASRWRRGERAAQLARRAGIEVIMASDPRQFRAAFDALHARRQQQVWVFAGDGTILWLLESLNALDDGWSPALLLLGGGRANVVPRECGGYPPMRALRRALAAHREGRPLPRMALPSLTIRQPGQPDRHGFFIAGGMVHEGVQVCSAHRARGEGWLHRSLAADFYALLKLLVQVVIGRSPLPPYTSMALTMADGRQLPSSPMRILLATTLGMGDALYNPFAANGEGSVRVTAIAADAPQFWRHLPGILRGRFGPSLVPERGVLSGRCQSVQVLGIRDYSLDGELRSADPSLPLTIEAGTVLTVLKP